MNCLHCPCCHDPTLEIRWDKHLRPYATCDSCSVKIFGRGARAIVGLTLTSELVEALAARMRTDRASLEHAMEVRARVEASLRVGAAPVSATAASLAEQPLAAAGGAR